MNNNFLFLSLKGGLQMAFMTRIPTQFDMNGLEFIRLGGDFNGFYDWLRNDQGVIGVRYVIFEGCDALRQELRSNEKVNILKDVQGDVLEFAVFFFDDANYLPKKSVDQAFCNDHTYRSASGEFGFTFELEDDREYENLKYSWERLRKSTRQREN